MEALAHCSVSNHRSKVLLESGREGLFTNYILEGNEPEIFGDVIGPQVIYLYFALVHTLNVVLQVS